jgi:glycosyltransferase involved in cell wall biosynthesis
MNQPLRIAMVAACPFPYPRGTPVRIHRMAEALGKRGHEVHVVTYHLGEPVDEAPFQVHRIRNISRYRDCAPGPSYLKLLLLDPLLRRTLRQVLRAHRIDLIHAHHYEGLMVALSLRERPPLVYDAHTLLESELPYYSLGLGRRMTSFLGRQLDVRLPGRATHVVSVTPTLRDRLLGIGAVRPGQISAVMNGVETELFEVAPVQLPGGQAPTVVFAGNLAAYQGIEHLLRAMAVVCEERPDVRLLILSETSFAQYEPLAHDLGIEAAIDVLDVPFEQLPGYLLAADVAVNPRLKSDGVPQKLMNYMAAGLPIVSFEGSAAHLRHGQTGWIVPNGDIGAFAEGILRMLDHPRLAGRIGRAARKEVTAEYSWERTAEKLEAVYDHLLRGTRKGAPAPRRAAEAAGGSP